MCAFEQSGKGMEFYIYYTVNSDNFIKEKANFVKNITQKDKKVV